MDAEQNKNITSSNLTDEQWKQFLEKMSEEEQERIFREEAMKFFEKMSNDMARRYIPNYMQLKGQLSDKDKTISKLQSEIELLQQNNKLNNQKDTTTLNFSLEDIAKVFIFLVALFLYSYLLYLLWG